MPDIIDKERAIRCIVNSAVKSYANGFSTRHLAEVDNENGVINMKIHNVFIAALGSEIQYYSALARSLDSSLGNMLENMAISIAKLNYDVTQHVEGVLYREQTDYIAELYNSQDFWNLVCNSDDGYDIVIDEYRKNAHYIHCALFGKKFSSLNINLRNFSGNVNDGYIESETENFAIEINKEMYARPYFYLCDKRGEITDCYVSY